MPEKKSVRRLVAAIMFCGVLVSSPVQGQEGAKKGGSVPITFVPPPMENATYSVGIYDVKTGKLARRLCEAAGQNTFKVGLNGLITSWDGKDDDGKPLPPGKYAARGYAVGPLKVEGEAVHGNDWAAYDESLRVTRVEAIGLVPEDDGLVAMAEMGDGGYALLRMSGKDGTLIWKKALPFNYANRRPLPYGVISVDGDTISLAFVGEMHGYRLSNGEPVPAGKKIDEETFVSGGKDGTVWIPTQDGVVQLSAAGLENGGLPKDDAALEKTVLRRLPVDADGPKPKRVSASRLRDKLYVLEDAPRWQRVRGLARVETKQENGKQVSTWQTFFERNIRPPDPALGLDEAASTKADSAVIDVPLEENPLSPGKPEHAKLTATSDEKGSYLTTADGLRLRQVSQREHLRAVKLTKGDQNKGFAFFQSDGVAWDEFSIKGAQKMLGFDAGEFEIDAAGEKPIAEKAPEPDL